MCSTCLLFAAMAQISAHGAFNDAHIHASYSTSSHFLAKPNLFSSLHVLFCQSSRTHPLMSLILACTTLALSLIPHFGRPSCQENMQNPSTFTCMHQQQPMSSHPNASNSHWCNTRPCSTSSISHAAHRLMCIWQWPNPVPAWARSCPQTMH